MVGLNMIFRNSWRNRLPGTLFVLWDLWRSYKRGAPHTHTHTHTYTHTHTPRPTHTHAYTRIHTHPHPPTHTHIHTHPQPPPHTHTHTRMNVTGSEAAVDCVWNVMAHAQKPYFVFRRNLLVLLYRRGRQFIRILAAETYASAVVMLDTPCSEVVGRVLATHSIRQFPLHFPSRVSPFAITFQLESTTLKLLQGCQYRNNF